MYTITIVNNILEDQMKKSLLIVFALLILASFMSMAISPPPPPPATCSPGFWKQPQHFQYWVGYDPGDPYPGSGMTLLDALQGGYDTRVSRFVVAGWLNAANPDAPCIDE
jgi:hypothetical protein